jgi:hypothetical protein
LSAPTSAAFLASLKDAADAAAIAEKDFRRQASERIKTLEQERAFAHRRLNVMRLVSDAVAGPASEEIAVAAGLAVLRTKLGWSSDSEARGAVLSRFATVARAMLATPEASADSPRGQIAVALADFESWYAATYFIPFWSLFEHEMVETPVVDF